MRRLNSNDLSQFNELLRYAFQVTDSDLLKFGWDNEEIKKSKRPILENALVLGWFDIDKKNMESKLDSKNVNLEQKQVVDSSGIATDFAMQNPRNDAGLQNLDSKNIILEQRQISDSKLDCHDSFSLHSKESRNDIELQNLASKNTKLISQIALYPMKMNIYNRIYDMGGITGVATYPEYSGIGLMMDLMREILKIMRTNGQSISCLYPYSIPYYRSRGWEIVSDKMTFSLSDRQVPRVRAVSGMVQRVNEFSPDLQYLHNEFAKRTHGCLVRDALAWEEYWRWDIEDTIVAIYYDENEAPQGYIVYRRCSGAVYAP